MPEQNDLLKALLKQIPKPAVPKASAQQSKDREAQADKGRKAFQETITGRKQSDAQYQAGKKASASRMVSEAQFRKKNNVSTDQSSELIKLRAQYPKELHGLIDSALYIRQKGITPISGGEPGKTWLDKPDIDYVKEAMKSPEGRASLEREVRRFKAERGIMSAQYNSGEAKMQRDWSGQMLAGIERDNENITKFLGLDTPVVKAINDYALAVNPATGPLFGLGQMFPATKDMMGNLVKSTPSMVLTGGPQVVGDAGRLLFGVQNPEIAPIPALAQSGANLGMALVPELGPAAMRGISRVAQQQAMKQAEMAAVRAATANAALDKMAGRTINGFAVEGAPRPPFNQITQAVEAPVRPIMSQGPGLTVRTDSPDFLTRQSAKAASQASEIARLEAARTARMAPAPVVPEVPVAPVAKPIKQFKPKAEKGYPKGETPNLVGMAEARVSKVEVKKEPWQMTEIEFGRKLAEADQPVEISKINKMIADVKAGKGDLVGKWSRWKSKKAALEDLSMQLEKAQSPVGDADALNFAGLGDSNGKPWSRHVREALKAGNAVPESIHKYAFDTYGDIPPLPSPQPPVKAAKVETPNLVGMAEARGPKVESGAAMSSKQAFKELESIPESIQKEGYSIQRIDRPASFIDKLDPTSKPEKVWAIIDPQGNPLRDMFYKNKASAEIALPRYANTSNPEYIAKNKEAFELLRNENELQKTTAKPQSIESGSDLFIREASPLETGSQAFKSRAFAAIPDKEGFKKVYKPYGEHGRGFYYVKDEAAVVTSPSKPAPKVETPAPVVEKGGKQPWEMTREEFSKHPNAKYHGGAAAIDEFRLHDRVRTTGGGLGSHTIAFSNPEVAGRYVKDFHPGGAISPAIVNSKKVAKLDPGKFHKLQDLVYDIDKGKTLTETQDVSLEIILKELGVDYSENLYKSTHPITLIKKSGYDAITTPGSIRGAEPEYLVLDPSTIKTHKQFISQALKDGKPVPAQVLADYPDLAAKYGKGAPKPVVKPIEAPTIYNLTDEQLRQKYTPDINEDTLSFQVKTSTLEDLIKSRAKKDGLEEQLADFLQLRAGEISQAEFDARNLKRTTSETPKAGIAPEPKPKVAVDKELQSMVAQGKKIASNRSEWWQARAKPGGEYGANGEWYEGGKFIAQSPETQKGAFRKVKKMGESAERSGLNPGETKVSAPSAGYSTIPADNARWYNGPIKMRDNLRGISEEEIASLNKSIKEWNELVTKVDKGTPGLRWATNKGEGVLIVDALKHPKLASAPSIARYMAKGELIPDVLVPEAKRLIQDVDIDKYQQLVKWNQERNSGITTPSPKLVSKLETAIVAEPKPVETPKAGIAPEPTNPEVAQFHEAANRPPTAEEIKYYRNGKFDKNGMTPAMRSYVANKIEAEYPTAWKAMMDRQPDSPVKRFVIDVPGDGTFTLNPEAVPGFYREITGDQLKFNGFKDVPMAFDPKSKLPGQVNSDPAYVASVKPPKMERVPLPENGDVPAYKSVPRTKPTPKPLNGGRARESGTAPKKYYVTDAKNPSFSKGQWSDTIPSDLKPGKVVFDAQGNVVKGELKPSPKPSNLEKNLARIQELEAKPKKNIKGKQAGMANITPDDIELAARKALHAVYTAGEHLHTQIIKIGKELGLSPKQRAQALEMAKGFDPELGKFHFEPKPKQVKTPKNLPVGEKTLKHADTAPVRESLGMPEYTKTAETIDDTFRVARERGLVKDARKIAASVIENPKRPVNKYEQAALIARADELDVLSAQKYEQLGNTPEGKRQSVLDQIAAIEDEYSTIIKASDLTGSAQGSALRLRREASKELTSANIKGHIIKANGGTLPHELEARIGALSEKLAKANQAVRNAKKAVGRGDAQAALNTAAKAEKSGKKAARGTRNRLFTKEAFEEVMARRGKGSSIPKSKQRGAAMIDAQDWKDLGTIVGYHIESGIRDFPQLMSKSKEVFPDVDDFEVSKAVEDYYSLKKLTPEAKAKAKAASAATKALKADAAAASAAGIPDLNKFLDVKISAGKRDYNQLKEAAKKAGFTDLNDQEFSKSIIDVLRERGHEFETAAEAAARRQKYSVVSEARALIEKTRVKAAYEETKGLKRAGYVTGQFIMSAPGQFKNLRASFDLSAAGRQGLLLSIAHPKKGAQALKSMLESVTKQGYEKVIADVHASKYFEAGQIGGLGIADTKGHMTTDELFTHLPFETKFGESPLGQGIKKYGGAIPRMSEQTYNAYLSHLRQNVFDSIAAGYEAQGGKLTKANAEQIAQYVNSMSGLAKSKNQALEGGLKFLNWFLFSSRFLTSRAQVGSGYTLGRALVHGGPLAKQAAKDHAIIIGGLSTILGLTTLAGGKVSANPDNPDFLQVQFGNQRVDITGGVAPVLRAMIRGTMGIVKPSVAYATGQPYTPPGYGQDAGTHLGRFFINRTSPLIRAGVNSYQGESFGRPTDPSIEARNLLMPIGAEQAINSATVDKRSISDTFTLAILEFFGLSTQFTDKSPGELERKAEQKAEKAAKKAAEKEEKKSTPTAIDTAYLLGK